MNQTKSISKQRQVLFTKKERPASEKHKHVLFGHETQKTVNTGQCRSNMNHNSITEIAYLSL